MLWGSAYNSYLHMIEILQKTAIRNVHKTKYNEHTMPLFRSSKILKIEDMYKLQLLLFMFSYYRNILPSPLYSLLTRNCYIHDHYTRCRKDPRTVARNTNIMTKSFICKGPELWGELSQNTKESKSLSSFKKQINEKRSEMMKKMRAADDKMRAADDKITADDDKITTDDDKITAGDDKMRADDDKINAADDKMRADDDKITVNDDKLRADDAMLRAADVIGPNSHQKLTKREIRSNSSRFKHCSESLI